MAFEPFDLGRVIQTAEAIKGIRRQSTTDSLREQYMGEQIQNMRYDRERQERTDQVTLGKDKAKEVYLTMQYAAQSENPKNFLESEVPELVQNLQKNGTDWATVDDAAAMTMIKGIMAKAGAEAGIAPEAPAGPMSAPGKIGADVRGGYLTQEQADAALNPGMSPYQRESLDIQRQRLAQGANKPAGQFRPLTPDEVTAAGLPAGTSAQVGPDGKIDVLSKRDNTGVLSQKDQTTAKLKLTTVTLARQQLNAIKEAFETGRGGPGLNAFGPGQGMLPTQAGKLFDSRVDQMRSTLTALTRVPGVGAMSDYETKLDQSKFPKRVDYEAVTGDKLKQLDDMLALIENGYTGLLSGGAQESPQAPPQQQQAPQQQGIDEAGYNALPSGTQYRAPDGTIRKKR